MNCACVKALGWRCLATSMCIPPLLITRLLLFCAISLLHSIISKARHLNNRITRFKTKISQGRILSTPCIDFQISNNYLTNYLTKFMYYSPLSELINLDTTYSCKIVIIIIGSTGCVHKNMMPGLKILGFDTRRSKAIAKYLSISAAIGSKIVGQMRVGAVNAQR